MPILQDRRVPGPGGSLARRDGPFLGGTRGQRIAGACRVHAERAGKRAARQARGIRREVRRGRPRGVRPDADAQRAAMVVPAKTLSGEDRLTPAAETLKKLLEHGRWLPSAIENEDVYTVDFEELREDAERAVAD